MAEWFFQLGGSVLGPITAQRLAEMASDGRLANGDLVRRGDQAAWVRAEQLQGLKFATDAPPLPAMMETSASDTVKTPPSVWLSVEVKSIASATLGHASRIPDFLLLRYGLWRNHRETHKAQVECGRELFEAGFGSTGQRDVIQKVIAELAAAEPKHARALNSKCDQLFIELTRTPRNEADPAIKAAARLVQLSGAERELRSQLAVIESELRPADSTERRRVCLGYGLILVTCIATWFLISTREKVNADHSPAVASIDAPATEPSPTNSTVTPPPQRRRFEEELRTVVVAGRPSQAAKSTPRIEGVVDGVARGFAVTEMIVEQLLIAAAVAEMKSSTEGDEMVNNMLVILGGTEDIQSLISRNDPQDFRGRVALAYTVAERLPYTADRTDERLARASISAQERATVGQAYRRVCEKLAARFEARYKKMISEGGHLLTQ